MDALNYVRGCYLDIKVFEEAFQVFFGTIFGPLSRNTERHVALWLTALVLEELFLDLFAVLHSRYFEMWRLDAKHKSLYKGLKGFDTPLAAPFILDARDLPDRITLVRLATHSMQRPSAAHFRPARPAKRVRRRHA